MGSITARSCVIPIDPRPIPGSILRILDDTGIEVGSSTMKDNLGSIETKAVHAGEPRPA